MCSSGLVIYRLKILVTYIFMAGAYYYYRTEEGKNYEQTILDIKANAVLSKLPYRYVFIYIL